MDTHFELNGDAFVWNAEKARTNLLKHGVRFEEAATVFSDPLFALVQAWRNDEAQFAADNKQARLIEALKKRGVSDEVLQAAERESA